MGDAGRDGTEMSEGVGSYDVSGRGARISVPPTSGAAEEGTGGKKIGISAAAGTVNQTCVFIGSDLDGPIGSDLEWKGSERSRVGIPRG